MVYVNQYAKYEVSQTALTVSVCCMLIEHYGTNATTTPRRVSPERVVLLDQPITVIFCTLLAQVRSREALVRRQLVHSGEQSHETTLGVYGELAS